MRVLVSNPPWFPDNGSRWGIRAGSRWPFTVPPGSGYYPYPFLLGYTTSYLRSHQIEAYMVDSILLRESLDSYFRRIVEVGFDWVIIETSTPSIENDLLIAEGVRRVAPSTKVALAGAHPAVFAEQVLEKPFIYAVLKGEFEENALKLVTMGEPGVYEYDLVGDIDAVPYPYRDSTIYRYSDRFPNTPSGPQLQMWASRGCPFRCVFCLWPPTMYKNKSRYRDPDSVIKEVEWVFRRFPRLRSVYFDDDTFNIGNERVQAIARGMKKLGIPWAAMCRADTSSLETFRVMAESGCYAVKFGIESGAQELVDNCQKHLDLEHVRASVRLLKGLGVWVHTTWTWGLPGETRETIKATQRFFRQLQPSSTQESRCTPFPGTPYYSALVQAGKLNLVDWGLMDGARSSVIESPDLSSADLLKYGRLRVRCFIVGRMLEQHMGPWLFKAAAQLGYHPVAIDPWEAQSSVHHLLDAYDDEIVLVDKGLGLSPELLKRVVARKILYYPDIMPTLTETNPHAEKRYQEFASIAPYFDVIILHDGHSLEYLKAQGHTNVVDEPVLLPFEPDLHRKIYGTKKIYDIVFIGLVSAYRKEWLEYIASRYPVHVPKVWGEEMVKTINMTKVVLNIHFTPILNTEHRITESLASGCFVMSQPLFNHDLFEDRKHLVYFDRENVLDLIEYYLTHEEERERIARQGMEEVRAKYTAKQQLERILEIAERFR